MDLTRGEGGLHEIIAKIIIFYLRIISVYIFFSFLFFLIFIQYTFKHNTNVKM